MSKNIQIWKSAAALVQAVLGMAGLQFGLLGVLFALAVYLLDPSLGSMADVIVAFVSQVSPAMGQTALLIAYLEYVYAVSREA